MQIWIDADACPVVVKEMLFRAAERKQIITTLVANQFLRTPPSSFIKNMQVESGFDVADNKIVQLLNVGDIVITGDIPLAAQVVEKGGVAINPRGELYTTANIQERLAMRNLMEELRSNGLQTSTTAPFNNADKKAFASTLDRLLAKVKPSI